MPFGSPRLTPKETTSAPPARATSAVASVDPSSITRTSASGSAPRASSSTPGSERSSFQAGMKTSVPAMSPGELDLELGAALLDLELDLDVDLVGDLQAEVHAAAVELDFVVAGELVGQRV